MEELAEEMAAMGMAHLGDLAVAGDAVVARRHEEMRGVARRLVHAGHLHDDEPDPAFGPGLVIGDQGLVRHEVGGKRGVVPGREDPVLQGDRTDA